MPSQLQTEYLKTADEYLAAERVAEQRHEYLAGSVYAMAGATADHQRITLNICRELGQQLRSRRCEVFSSDMKVLIRTGAASFFYYPDAVVDCSDTEGSSHFIEKPALIFEVLSPEAARIDREEKRRNYQALSSLKSYVLVDQLRIEVTVYRRAGSDWKVELLTARNDVLKFPEIDCVLPVTAIYERTGVLR